MPENTNKTYRKVIRALLLLAMLYAFLLSIETLGVSFKMLGAGFADTLMRTTGNPVIGLCIGLFVTSVVQSSSCTTSLVVALVGANVISIQHAVPVIMGANIGTTITNTIVSLGHMGRRDEFKRALGAATVHDMFNILCVCIFLPLEMATRFLETTARLLADAFRDIGGLTFISPLNLVTQPVAGRCGDAAAAILPAPWAAAAVIAVSLFVLFFALIGLVKIMRSAAEGRFEVLFDRYVGRYPYLALLLGVVVTGTIQSSSVVTSLLVPIVGAGILTVEQIYPVTLGANIGTTVTALLAALATNRVDSLAIALVHTLFNMLGTFIFFVLPWTKRIPIGMAKALASLCAKTRYYAILYIIVAFFGIPGLIILFRKLLGGN